MKKYLVLISAKFIFLLFVSVVIFAYNSPKIYAATPTVLNLTTNSTTIQKYAKFEATFNISKTFSENSFLPYYYYDSSDSRTRFPNKNSPYGEDGITIDFIFTTPSSKTLVVPAFYFQSYTRTRSGNGDAILTPQNQFSWKLRFAPSETGTYNYYVSIKDKDGNSRYPQTGSLQLTVTNSNLNGFVKVSSRDSRFFEFSNGKTYIPIGSGLQWSLCCRSYGFEDFFTEWKSYGINFTRIWFQNDGFNITLEGRYDAYSWPDDYRPTDNGVNIANLPKGTQINQRGAYEIDKIFESAEKNNVYIVYAAHGDAYWIWDASVYDEDWNSNITNFDNEQHINYWKRNFRYRVARWGYSTSLLAWETWNEHGHILPGQDEYRFYQKYGEFQQTTDTYNHIKTTSQNSQAFSPGLFSLNTLDSINYHDYLDSRTSIYQQLSSDEVNFLLRFSWCLRGSSYNNASPASTSYCNGLGLGDGSTWSGNTKPFIWGEIGLNEFQDGERGARFLHNMVWAGLFSPISTTPLDWYADIEDSTSRNAKYQSRKAASIFFNNLDLASYNFSYLVSALDKPPGYNLDVISTNNSKTRAFAMRSNDKKSVFLWAQNRDYIWSKSTTSVSPYQETISIPNMVPGIYNIEIWDTRIGTILYTNQINTTTQSLNIPVPSLSRDVAIKAFNTLNPIVTPTPTITPGQSEDLNNDGKIDILDILDLIKKIFDDKYIFNNPDANPDINNDGKINLMDIIALIQIIFGVQN